jgi:cytoskeleton protein RodZ
LYGIMPEDNRTIGEILKKAREDQGLSLDEIAVMTRVRPKYLAAIEADHYQALPSPVQIKGFVRSYARVLGLDPAPLVSGLRSLILNEHDLDPEDLQASQTPQISQSPQPLGEIGSVLKTQRERLGFSIASVETQIFIPARYLTAIENGSLEELPSTVQGKGMVKNYARFLGLDPEPLLMSFADVLQNRLLQTRVDEPELKIGSSFRAQIRRFIGSPTILWVGVVLLISIVSIWSAWLIFGNRAAGTDATPTIPGVSDILLPTATATEIPAESESAAGEIEIDISTTPEPVENEGVEVQPTATPGFNGNEKVQVQLVIVQRAWVRVTVDNIVAFEGRLIPGSVKLFGGELSIEVLTGNAGGVEVIFNQQDLGAMGLFGEAIDRVYTAEGIATPTPTISPTPLPSDTPIPSVTPTPTLLPES